MRTEAECEPWERYLFANEFISRRAISLWQHECIKRCKNKPKNVAYNQYIQWECQENEILILTLYAYADFAIPKTFDIIFQKDNPDNLVEVQYEIVQSVHEAWFPIECISHGHKHLCVFRFKKNLPSILHLLHEEKKFPTSQIDQTELGFCSAYDFSHIKKEMKRKANLKQQHGDDWSKYDAHYH